MAGRVENLDSPNPKEDLQTVYSQIVDELGTPFHKTRSGYAINQNFFARLWGTKRLALYDQKSEAFYHYLPEQGLFATLRENTIRQLINEDLFAEARQGGRSDIGSKATAAIQRGIIELIKSDKKVCQQDFFKRDPTAAPVIHCTNGMVCITESGVQLKPFSPDYKSRNQIPIAYEPESLCKRFLGELLGSLSEQDIDMLQRYCGLILIGGNRAQKILFLLGQGGTGKGTIVRLISTIIGTANVEQLRIDKLNERFETQRLIGKLLLNVVEAPADFFTQRGAEIVKALCGHDLINAEKKGVNESLGLSGIYPVLLKLQRSLARPALPGRKRLGKTHHDYRISIVERLRCSDNRQLRGGAP